MKPNILQTHFGTTPSGEDVSLFALTNAAGMEVKITNFGGVVTEIRVPDRRGQFADVVLGFDKLEPYLQDSPYFGALIGRFGNRIAKGRFKLDGRVFGLAVNDEPNHLHGGVQGFDKVVWSPTTFVTPTEAGVKLVYLSPDGDQGYPGNLRVTVTYTLTAENGLQVEYHAVTDKSTPINLTQHSYFNLAGYGDVLGHQIIINADNFVPIDATSIPLGHLQAVANTPFDFRTTKTIGADINSEHQQIIFGRGYDHNFVLCKSENKELSFAAKVVEPESGRVLEVYTEEPGVQFYSGNFLDGSLTGKGKTYTYRSGFCLEPQHYPDSPNQPDFPTTILHPGDAYVTRTIFKFSAL